MILLLLLTNCLNFKLKQKEKPGDVVYNVSESVVAVNQLYNIPRSIDKFGPSWEPIGFSTNIGSCVAWPRPLYVNNNGPFFSTYDHGLFKCHSYNSFQYWLGNNLEITAKSELMCHSNLYGNYNFIMFFINSIDDIAEYRAIIFDEAGKVISYLVEKPPVYVFNNCFYDFIRNRIIFVHPTLLWEYKISPEDLSISKGEIFFNNFDIKGSVYFPNNTNYLIDYNTKQDSPLSIYQMNSDKLSSFTKIFSGDFTSSCEIFDCVLTHSFFREGSLYFTGYYDSLSTKDVYLYKFNSDDLSFSINLTLRLYLGDPSVISQTLSSFSMEYISDFDIVALIYLDRFTSLSETKVSNYKLRTIKIDEENSIFILSDTLLIIEENNILGEPSMVFIKNPDKENKGKIRIYYTYTVGEVNIIKYQDVYLSLRKDDTTTTVTVTPTDVSTTTTSTTTEEYTTTAEDTTKEVTTMVTTSEEETTNEVTTVTTTTTTTTTTSEGETTTISTTTEEDTTTSKEVTTTPKTTTITTTTEEEVTTKPDTTTEQDTTTEEEVAASGSSSGSEAVIASSVGGAVAGLGVIGTLACWVKKTFFGKQKIALEQVEPIQEPAMYENPVFAGHREDNASEYQDLDGNQQTYRSPSDNTEYADLNPEHAIYLEQHKKAKKEGKGWDTLTGALVGVEEEEYNNLEEGHRVYEEGNVISLPGMYATVGSES